MQYLRRDTRTTLLYIVAVLAIICGFIAVEMIRSPNESARQVLLQIFVAFGPAVLVAAALLLASYKNVFFIELVGPSLMHVYCFFMFLINWAGILGDATEEMRLSQIYLLITLEVCLALFASATWHVGYLARHPVFLLVLTAAVVNRVQHGDDV